MEFNADERYVRVLGRTLFRDGIRYLGYSCSAIEFTFTGKRAEAVLWTNSPKLEAHLKAWVAVFIDEEETPSKRFMLNEETGTYLLYEGNVIKTTRIRLVKYSEAAFGKVGVQKIILDGEQSPEPTSAKSRSLEFIGDSITCGYGNEGLWNTDTFHTAQENPWEAYAARMARRLEADYHLVCWSGIGIISNWTDQEVPNEEILMPILYPYTDWSTDLTLENVIPEQWDNNRFVPDCIVINLGTNDNSYTKGKPERVAVFETKYYDFIKEVRRSNPSSMILCTLGAMGQELYEAIHRQVERLVEEGDSKLHAMPFDVQSVEDGIGADWHPSKTTHDKMAVMLEARIRELLNWRL
ncbi:MAG: lipolytic protein family [Herbinix sp.]|nr:lipolytic protein family [Herbinix sp.]